MKKLFIVLLMFTMSGCAVGPLRVTHTDGEMPKVKMNMPSENLHLRAHGLDEVELMWEMRF